mmetsp:Transcript_75195/g.224170  ORF Transcript_75195/g.224170 Transcript_75195/m.224170 type:complete len:231 (+) Transcript_75195:516-1208(+)
MASLPPAAMPESPGRTMKATPTMAATALTNSERYHLSPSKNQAYVAANTGTIWPMTCDSQRGRREMARKPKEMPPKPIRPRQHNSFTSSRDSPSHVRTGLLMAVSVAQHPRIWKIPRTMMTWNVGTPASVNFLAHRACNEKLMADRPIMVSGNQRAAGGTVSHFSPISTPAASTSPSETDRPKLGTRSKQSWSSSPAARNAGLWPLGSARSCSCRPIGASRTAGVCRSKT